MRTVEWHEGHVRIIDQRQLPWTLTTLDFEDYRDVAQAIAEMAVRGAPAVGVAAAFGMALAAQQSSAMDMGSLLDFIEVAAVIIKKSRPTLANLSWAVERMIRAAHEDIYSNVKEIKAALIAEAQRIANENIAAERAISKHGAALIQDGNTVLHHCNSGALSAVEYGTALGAVRAAYESGKHLRILLTETRPHMQGARLSAWELRQLGIPFEIITDSAAGYYMRKGEVDIVLVGASRVVANGDTANNIGTYTLAVLARENNIPFYVVAPVNSIDLNTPGGEQVEIEERSPDEVRSLYGNALIPDEYPVRNPTFDITPQRYLAGIVTERGLILPPFRDNLLKSLGEAKTAKS
jgi:methylthioribose-1-phosphate isomerase